MNTILKQFQDKINSTYSFFDRMIIKGHIRQFFSPSGKKHFLSYNNVLLMDFSAYVEQVTSSLVSHVETFTASSGRPEKGRRIMGSLIETRKRTYPELAS